MALHKRRLSCASVTDKHELKSKEHACWEGGIIGAGALQLENSPAERTLNVATGC